MPALLGLPYVLTRESLLQTARSANSHSHSSVLVPSGRAKSHWFVPCVTSVTLRQWQRAWGSVFEGCRWMGHGSACTLLTGKVPVNGCLSRLHPRGRSRTLLAFVIGLHFPLLSATTHVLMFLFPREAQDSAHPPLPTRLGLQCWSEAPAPAGTKSKGGEMQPYKAFSVRREVGQW